jgi:para-nitrobenzyl esterase
MNTQLRSGLTVCGLLLSAQLSASCGDDSPEEVQVDASAATAIDARVSDAGLSADSDVPSAAPRVNTADGELSGKADGTVNAFLGIPYAKPPLGALRWRPPQPSEPWSGVRDATQFGKRCAQQASTVLQNAGSEDEDCLVLNVWAPASAKGLPVMFWIHGGGNVNGSASEPLPYVGSGAFYSGKPLAEKGVVVVTINYRLGALGFLDHAALGAEGGNQGLLDQHAALSWVAKNVAAFGGDPGNVTIFGESAGSYDVCAHVASPLSRGLFHRAVSQSGGCTNKLTSKVQAQAAADKLATALGCTGDVLACLRGKSVAELLAAVTSSALTLGPAVDGKFLPDQPRALYDRGEIAKVPYILGSNTDEGTLFVQNVTVTDQASYDAALGTSFGAGSVAAVGALYPATNFPNGKPNPFAAAFARAVGDARLVCTTHDSAARALAAGSKVYGYNFDIPAPVGGLGATHGAELTSVFGTSSQFTPQAKAASELIQRYWTRFASTGDPNGGSDLVWPALSSTSDVRVNLALTSTLVNDFRAQECKFWRARYDATYAAP